MAVIPPISEPVFADGLCLVKGTGGVSLCWRGAGQIFEIASLADFGGGLEMTRMPLVAGSHCFSDGGRIKLNE